VSSPSEFPAEAGAAGDPPVVPGRFAGRTAIVTGAGSGIGRATAVRVPRPGPGPGGRGHRHLPSDGGWSAV
jgi:hypothetical protein